MAMIFATDIQADGNNTRGVGTATNKFKINGLITGNTTAFYGTCGTAAATAAKIVTCADFPSSPATGTVLIVNFTNNNTKASPTLTITSDGSTVILAAKTIYRYGTTAPSSSAKTSWNAGMVEFVYNGTQWCMVGWLNDDTTSTVDQLAVITTNGEYSLLHAQNTGTAKRAGYSVYKSSATINPSTGQISMNGKPVMIGEYSSSSAPASPVTGEIWLKDATMTIEEAKPLVVQFTASTLPTTVTDSNITADMEVIKSDIGNPDVQQTNLTVSTSAGSLTVSGTISGATPITLWLARCR